MSDAIVTSLQGLISEEIRVLLIRRRMTARQLADRIGWSESQMSRKLTGRAGLTVHELERIAQGLSVPVADLLPRSGDGVNSRCNGADLSDLLVAA